ncbi:Rhodanese-like protein [Sistotremastrum suecicum HHB10207 ss-3]|uniref:Rhodanese-like protein n=1 Tax=Sistotremastrum suecicum HHB10207 ss-3 TaxID=1314776 RepID=A0A166G681_9AGAM|nr:Rhodanese-like protein [Sistotremastrum suecicum HHB10207 ss-3]
MLRFAAQRVASRAVRPQATVFRARQCLVANFGTTIRRQNAQDPSKPGDAVLEEHKKLQSDWTAPLVHYDTVKAWSERPSFDAYLIDVREPDETIQGIIPSAVTLPLSGMSKSLHLAATDFKAQHGYEKPLPHQEIIFYCRSGKRSQTAADIARRNGYKNVKSYDGSWLDWVKREQSPSSSS